MPEPNDPALQKEISSFLWVAALSLAGGCALVAVRFALTDRFFYFFLLWNLVLALVPYGIAVLLFKFSRVARSRKNTAILAILSLSWLVFYPNAPYIFTDFIHIVNRTFVRSGTDLVRKETLLWFDLVLCSAFAFMGHSAGLISIDLVLRSYKGLLKPVLARALVGMAITLAGVGIYIGRFVRFNSWDILLDPVGIASNTLPTLFDGPAVLLCSAFSAFILITYVVHHLSRR